METNLIQIGKSSKNASRKLAIADAKTIDMVLKNIADSMIDRSAEIIEANRADINAATKLNLDDHMIDRLVLDKDRIQKLEARNKELELIAPAMQALSDITHDPELVLNNLVPKDQIQIKDGKPIVVDGYEQLPVAEYVKTKLAKEKPYLLKNKLPFSFIYHSISKLTANFLYQLFYLKLFQNF